MASLRRRFAIFWIVALVGLYPAWLVACDVTYASEGYDPARDNSDDGGITVLLDGIAVLAGTMLAYAVLVGVAYVVLRKVSGRASQR